MLKTMHKVFSKIHLLIDLNFNTKVKNIMDIGITISFIAILFATLIMTMYLTTNPSYILFDIGISIFKSFTMFAVMFFIDGITFNSILKGRCV